MYERGLLENDIFGYDVKLSYFLVYIYDGAVYALYIYIHTVAHSSILHTLQE